MSILNVNQIQPVGGGNTITVNASDVSASGVTITASSFVGPVTGNVTSSSTSTFSSGINVTGGLVGIGTDNPNAPLHVEKDGTSQVLARFESNMGTNNDRSISLNSPTSDSGSEPFIFNTGNGYQFQTDDQVALHINHNRKVGIGTDNPVAKLEVVDSSSLGIISRSGSTQVTDTNKALKVRNNSSTDTFNVSYKGQGYFAGKVGIGTDNPTVSLHSYHATTNTVAKFESGDAGVNIRFKDGDTTNEMGIGAAENDFIVSATSGGERLRITSDGKVGIGTISVPNNFNVEIANNGSTGLNLRNTNDSANDSCRITFSQGSGNLSSSNTFADIFSTVDTVSPLSGHIKFRTNEGNNLVERLRITSGGDVTINNGDLILGTAGKGISFINAADVASGETVSSSVLDDYEEGTWTPAVDGGTVNSASWGRYIKIGTRVDLFFRVSISTMDNSTSGFLITGTPFDPMSGVSGGFTGSCMTNNIYFQDANATAVVTYNASNTNGIRLYSMENNGGWRNLRRVEVNANDSVYGTSSFRVD